MAIFLVFVKMDGQVVNVINKGTVDAFPKFCAIALI
jgi:hypothetical protein